MKTWVMILWRKGFGKKAVFLLACLLVPAILLAQWTTSGNDIYNSNSGRVGIGTTTPWSIFHVNGGLGVFTDRGDGRCADLRLIGGDASQETHLYSFGTGYGSGRFGIHKYGTGSAGGEVFSILPDGKVGIGTVSPSSLLHVAGNVTVDGNISAKYQDLAEWVPATLVIAPGTVVALDSTNVNSVLPSSTAYDTRVAGVVSATPGILLGEAGDNKVKVATTGRVKVRVDASLGSVQIGDLLVTSGKEGVAMRSQPVSLGGIELHRPGTLIGKALEPLSDGEGEILVLLSLQ